MSLLDVTALRVGFGAQTVVHGAGFSLDRGETLPNQHRSGDRAARTDLCPCFVVDIDENRDGRQ